MAPIRMRQLTFPALVKGVLVAIVIGAILWYAHFQARFFIAGPQIELESPQDVHQQEQMVEVRGHAQNIVELTLNGRPIHTNEGGYFEEELVVPEGYTIMTLRAKDRYGRVETLSRPLVYESEETANQ